MNQKNKLSTNRNTGSSLIKIPLDYTLVDLETTGFSSIYNNIIEFACVKIRDGKEIDRYQSLINPLESIPYMIELKTDINNEMVKNAPTFKQIAPALWNFLQGELIVGHNIKFDILFLYDNFTKYLNKEFKNDYIDTLRLSRKIYPDFEDYQLDTICYELNINAGIRHRSLSDCLITNEVLKAMAEKVKNEDLNLAELFKKKRHYKKTSRVDLTTIQGNEDNFNKEHVFFDKVCVFTGKLEIFTRVQAARIVAGIGGRCENSVTQRTNFLIVGDMDYKKGLEGYKSSKLQKAEQLIEKHQDLQIIPESAFYDLVDDYIT